MVHQDFVQPISLQTVLVREALCEGVDFFLRLPSKMFSPFVHQVFCSKHVSCQVRNAGLESPDGIRIQLSIFLVHVLSKPVAERIEDMLRGFMMRTE